MCMFEKTAILLEALVAFSNPYKPICRFAHSRNSAVVMEVMVAVKISTLLQSCHPTFSKVCGVGSLPVLAKKLVLCHCYGSYYILVIAALAKIPCGYGCAECRQPRGLCAVTRRDESLVSHSIKGARSALIPGKKKGELEWV